MRTRAGVNLKPNPKQCAAYASKPIPLSIKSILNCLKRNPRPIIPKHLSVMFERKGMSSNYNLQMHKEKMHGIK